MGIAMDEDVRKAIAVLQVNAKNTDARLARVESQDLSELEDRVKELERKFDYPYSNSSALSERMEKKLETAEKKMDRFERWMMISPFVLMYAVLFFFILSSCAHRS